MPNSRNTIVPCLWLDDQAERAADFYTKLFPAGRVSSMSHYPESVDSPTGKPPGSVLTVELELAGQRFTLLNGGPQFTINPSISFFVYVDAPSEADRLFGALSEGGSVLMPLGEYPWSKRYGWVQDRFGVTWQVSAGRPAGDATIVSCFMFTDAERGNAEQAISTWTRIFPDARAGAVDDYGNGAALRRFELAGQQLAALDSPGAHAFSFNEAVSIQVMCADQKEIDRYWSALSEGGEEGPCGWLKDRFGVSWQVVPAELAKWLTSKDVAARERAFAAVMRMKKLDIAAIEAAYAGKSS